MPKKAPWGVGAALTLLFLLTSESTTVVMASDDLSEITPAAATTLLLKPGVWVLESIDSRPLNQDCKGQFTLRFVDSHSVDVGKCFGGHTTHQTSDWKVEAEGEDGKVITIEYKKWSFFLRDDGTGKRHEYRMRIRQDDVENPKSGFNLLHDYRFIPK